MTYRDAMLYVCTVLPHEFQCVGSTGGRYDTQQVDSIAQLPGGNTVVSVLAFRLVGREKPLSPAVVKVGTCHLSAIAEADVRFSRGGAIDRSVSRLCGYSLYRRRFGNLEIGSLCYFGAVMTRHDETVGARLEGSLELQFKVHGFSFVAVTCKIWYCKGSPSSFG